LTLLTDLFIISLTMVFRTALFTASKRMAMAAATKVGRKRSVVYWVMSADPTSGLFASRWVAGAALSIFPTYPYRDVHIGANRGDGDATMVPIFIASSQDPKGSLTLLLGISGSYSLSFLFC